VIAESAAHADSGPDRAAVAWSALAAERLDVPGRSGGFVFREVVRFAFFTRRPHLQPGDPRNRVHGRGLSTLAAPPR
jgi:hypothetical protein